MNEPVPTLGQQGSQDDILPPMGEAVLVQFEGFRCMAFRDREGKWRDCIRKEELHGTVQAIIRLY
jgi:hypothetical protein